MKKLIFLLNLLMITSNIFSQVVPKDDLTSRRYEPVIIKMGNFPDFLNKSLKIDNFYLYTYDDDTKNWQGIPFQIDERNKNGSYFGFPTDTLDKYDELVFMVKDLGDKVPDGFWITNPESRTLPRYEIEIIDNFRSGKKTWGYLFYSNSITDFVADDYIEYNSINDIVYSDYYQVEFNPTIGLPWHYKITNAGGGTTTDILDRIKFRVKVEADIPAYGKYDIVLSEENIFKQTPIQFNEPKTRLIRNMRTKIKISGIPVVGTIEEDSVYMPIHFFPYNVQLESDNIDLNVGDIGYGIDAKIKLIRTSMDLNANANGMIFYNKYNRDIPSATNNYGNLIDGVGGPNIEYHTLDIPGLNWFIVTGNHGSIFLTTTVPDIGDVGRRWVYYFDLKNSSQTWDGTSDTGGLGSWGDSGIAIWGDDIQGKFSLQSNTYFLPKNQPVETGDTLNANIENPVTTIFNSQNFDTIAPAKITTLNAFPESDTKITLLWTAPGDDGFTGKATKYEIGFSKTAPAQGEEDVWFNTIAEMVTNPPQPSESGNEETFSVTGLEPLTTYYFGIRSYDESDVNSGNGNAAPVSNIATGLSLDVELISFVAQATLDAVIITWKTASEDNNLGFEIQRKQNNNPYEVIAFVPGNGTISEQKEYSFIDNHVSSGIYYYRLKQIDLDGSIHIYSDVQVNVGAPSQYALHQNYPNPFNPTTTLVYDLAESGHVNLAVYNTKGQIMKVVVDEFRESGRYKENVDASSWPSGIYFARMAAGSNNFIMKLIKLE